MTIAALRPGRAGDRPARVRGPAGLVEAGDRHAVLRPSPARGAARRSARACGRRRGTCRGSCARFCASMSTGLLTSVARISSSVRLGATARTRSSWRAGLPGLALVVHPSRPPSHGCDAEELHRVVALGRARGVGERRRGDEQPGDVVGVAVVAQRALVVDDVLRPAAEPGGRRAARPVLGLEHAAARSSRRWTANAGQADVERLDAVAEVVGPGVGRRHVEQVLDVDRRDDGLAREEALAGLGLDARAAAALEHQPRRPAGRSRTVPPWSSMKPHERVGQRARAAARQRPRAPLAAVDDRRRELAGARPVERLRASGTPARA